VTWRLQARSEMLSVTTYGLLTITVFTIVAAGSAAGVTYYKRKNRVLHHGDALSLLAISALSHGPARLDDALLRGLVHSFATIAPQYATRENAATILAVLEVCGAATLRDGIIELTHKGFQMRRSLANGEPARGLAAAFKRQRRSFALTLVPATNAA
jgi:hypothetical protein